MYDFLCLLDEFIHRGKSKTSGVYGVVRNGWGMDCSIFPYHFGDNAENVIVSGVGWFAYNQSGFGQFYLRKILTNIKYDRVG